MRTLFLLASLLLSSQSNANDLEIVNSISGHLSEVMQGPSAKYCIDCTEKRNNSAGRNEQIQDLNLEVRGLYRCSRPLDNFLAPADCTTLPLPSNTRCHLSITSTQSAPQADRHPSRSEVRVPGVRRGEMVMDRLVFFNGAQADVRPISLGQQTRVTRRRNNVSFTYAQGSRDQLVIENVAINFNVRDEGQRRVWEEARCH